MWFQVLLLYSHNKIAQAHMLISVSNFDFKVRKYLQKDGFSKIYAKIGNFRGGFCENFCKYLICGSNL
jgi:hypothetical protein